MRAGPRRAALGMRGVQPCDRVLLCPVERMAGRRRGLGAGRGAFELAEPVVGAGLGDQVAEIADDLDEARLLARADLQDGAVASMAPWGPARSATRLTEAADLLREPQSRLCPLVPGSCPGAGFASPNDA